MDTLFRLVTLQHQQQLHQQQQQQQQQSDQSFNSTSRTSSSSRSSTRQTNPLPHPHPHPAYPNNYYQQQEEDEECFNFFMDEEDFSSSSSKQTYYPYHHHHQQQQQTTTTTTTNTTTPSTSTTPTTTTPHHYAIDSSTDHFSFTAPSPHHDLNFDFSGKWATEILLETARAISDKNSARVQHLMWMLNELASPYGDTDQKLASYFLQALFSRMTDSGGRCYRTLSSASERNSTFESTRKMLLKFQEVSPWTTFGHVSCNGAILEALDGESKLHIIDFSNTYCTQWPTLLEALATRTDETPHLKLTTVVSGGVGAQRVMKEIGGRMEKFARLMGVPFKFHVINHTGDLSDLNWSEIDIKEDEALAVNAINALHSVSAAGSKREYFISNIRRLQPRILTVVEEEADLAGVAPVDFVNGFEECLRYFRVYFESLDESFSRRTSNEQLMLERGAGRAIVDLVACEPSDSIERRESATRWTGRLRACGFNGVGFSDEVSDDVRALLRRYKEGCWSMTPCSGGDATGIFLCWKEQPVVWASAWRP